MSSLTTCDKVLPVICPGGSDTATFDNVLEFLVMAGRTLPHAVLMMIPEPWAGNPGMDPAVRAFYEYHSSLMEPWDGPASIAFTDGTLIGAVLDRNGLRPSRYCITKDDLVIMASEVGVLDIPVDRVVVKDRLRPGKMLLVDTAQGRIISDDEIKRTLAAEHPYGEWLQQHSVDIEDLPSAYAERPDHQTVLRRQQAFGYTQEDLRVLLTPMALAGEEPIGSMGTDTALAVLSNRPRLLYDYFKQLFAQVTNPPLDAIREELVTSMASTIGPEGNLLASDPHACRQIKIEYPILHNDQVAKLRHLPPGSPFRSTTIPLLYNPDEDGPGLERAMADVCRKASQAVAAGYGILILSDRGVDATHAPIPSLLATAGVHHHLVREGTRTRCGLLVETGDAREVHHVALLMGYGAGAVNPYLAFETLHDLILQGLLPNTTHHQAVMRYVKALNKGILKVMSKMGISTLQSYCGAQIFEAVGLDRGFVDTYFTSTRSPIGGIGLSTISEEVRQRHARAFGGAAHVAHAARALPGPNARTLRVGVASGPRSVLRPNSRAAANINGGATANCTCSTRRRCFACNTPRAQVNTACSRSTRGSSTTKARSARRCGGCFASSLQAPPSRSARSSQSTRFCRASRPGRCCTARSVRKRTKPWPSR